MTRPATASAGRATRPITHALPMMAVTQIRSPATPARLHYQHKPTAGKTPNEGAAVPQPAAVRPGLPPAPAGRHGTIAARGFTYDPAADAACIHRTSTPLAPGRTTVQAPTPPGTGGFAAPDCKDGRLVGIEILDASTRLHQDLLDEAEING